ncbi:hypothetical protein EDB86DRAFT_2831448 [Lactarius hatsudake]|nr:hypothetical protein EDB86DRAFT_2831448 [Lactarius hatsudake]
MNPDKRKREQLPDIPRKRRRIVLNVSRLIDPACAKWTLILSLLRHSRRRPPRLFKKPTCPKTIHCADARSASAPERNNRSAYAFAGSRNGGQQPLAITGSRWRAVTFDQFLQKLRACELDFTLRVVQEMVFV